MVVAWYLNDNSDSPGQIQSPDPSDVLTVEELRQKTGIECLTFDADTWETNPEYAELKRKRGYHYEDGLEISREALSNYDEMLHIFNTEHLHADEEIRFVTEGGGYFDLRDSSDRWIRVHVTKNDLLILPAGIYHRFTLDKQNFIRMRRLFTEEVVWKATNRPEADQLPARKNYLQAITA
ncbi:unnamed protein product [Candidula unifasciata]|uniref:Acireductone dioxygenase n=1 Tax=Candidula unifasciata TaxID=100452 RepID=A0A8S4A4Q2_9EUPU|nr:unnamed protein product [Candidula unifasciata]